jgi:hypothetical protein
LSWKRLLLSSQVQQPARKNAAERKIVPQVGTAECVGFQMPASLRRSTLQQVSAIVPATTGSPTMAEFEIGVRQLPLHMHQPVLRYIERGIPPDSFLRSIFENDFVHAACSAEPEDQVALLAYATFLYCDAPIACWGSANKVECWIEKGGLAGHLASVDANWRTFPI